MTVAALLCLQGCNSRCPETVEDVCRERDCPDSPRDALDLPCKYPQVFVQGSRFVVGNVDGYGGLEYHFSGEELVGFRTHTDTFAERDECPLSFNVGEDVFASRRLEHIDGDSCFEPGDEGCLESCTFCPDLEETLGRCSEDIFDSL
jgi:hypothetical protein